jgi:glycosyltransferase involved in cell wall biosynthesis
MLQGKTVFINRKPVSGPWGGGNKFLIALIEGLEASGAKVLHDLYGPENVDYIFMMDPRPGDLNIGLTEIAHYKAENQGVRVLYRVNECDARKNTVGMDELVATAISVADHTVYVSQWMGMYYKEFVSSTEPSLLPDKHSVIINGVDTDMMYPPKSTWYHKNKKPKVVTHHWSNHPLKGFDVYEFLDGLVARGLIEFTYIGRDRGTFKHSTVIPPLHGVALAEELRSHEVYVSGSRFDPGPNHILEALACGLPTFACQNGGGAEEFADYTYTSLESLEANFTSKDWLFGRPSYGLAPHGWPTCIREYIRTMVNITPTQLLI